MGRRRVKVTVTVEVPGLDMRRFEFLTGEVQATMLDAAQELEPVAKRLRQRHDAQAIEASMTALKRSTCLLAKLTKFAR
jgi:hypothetical protein